MDPIEIGERFTILDDEGIENELGKSWHPLNWTERHMSRSVLWKTF